MLKVTGSNAEDTFVVIDAGQVIICSHVIRSCTLMELVKTMTLSISLMLIRLRRELRWKLQGQQCGLGTVTLGHARSLIHHHPSRHHRNYHCHHDNHQLQAKLTQCNIIFITVIILIIIIKSPIITIKRKIIIIDIISWCSEQS